MAAKKTAKSRRTRSSAQKTTSKKARTSTRKAGATRAKTKAAKKTKTAAIRKPVAKKTVPAKKSATTKKAAVTKKASAAKKSGSTAAGATAAPPPIPNAMGLVVSHADYTTHNFEEVRRFYTQQLGFSRFQYDPNFRYLWIQTTHQSSVGFMPPMPGADMPLPPREPTIYFVVRDIDEAYRKLQARGVSFEAPPETMPWGHRIVRTRDPEGRSIILAQDMSRPRS